MKQARLLVNFCRLLTVFLCLFAGEKSLAVGDDAREIARQTASAANDEALTLDERREALKKLKEAVPLFISAGDSTEAARVLNRVGRLQRLLNEPRDALESYQQALNLLKGKSTEVVVDSLNELGATYLLLQDLSQSKKVLRRSLRLNKKMGYTAGKAQALLTLSDAQNYGNHALSLKTARAAFALWQTLNDKKGLAHTYAQIGRCYMAQNSLAEATQNYQTALSIWQELNNPSEQAGVLIMLGYIEYRKAEWQSEISYMTQAQGLIDENSEPQKMGRIAAGLAEAFNESGLPEIGLGHFKRALEYNRQSKNPHLVRFATLGIGKTYRSLQKYPEALDTFHQALEGVEKDSLEAAPNYEYLGMVHSETGEPEIALDYLNKALAIYRDSANPKEAAEVLGLMGKVYQQQGQLKRARQFYLSALGTFIAVTDKSNQAMIYYALGRLELQAGNLDAAEVNLKRSLAATEDIRRFSSGSDLIAAFSSTVHDRYEAYIECLMRKHRNSPDQGLAAEALEISESARARSLNEVLRSSATGFAPGVDRALVAREKLLRQSLRVREDQKVRLLAGDYKRAELTSVQAELARLGKEYKQVTEIIRARYPDFEKLTRPPTWNLKQIQEQVVADDQTVLLEFSLGADKSYVWAVTSDDLKSYELPPQNVINDAARKVYELLATPPTSATETELTAAAAELSKIILSPVAEQLNKQRLIVVADGGLNYVPFQLLPAPTGKGEQLVVNYEVINAPSASVLGQLRQETARRQPAPNVLAAFGDPVFASNYAQQPDKTGTLVAKAQPQAGNEPPTTREIVPVGDSFDPAELKPLFYSRSELANLRDVAGETTLLATGFNATAEKLRNTDLTKYAILHLATHGFLNTKRPEKSGLALSTVNSSGQEQNGFVGLEDIYGLHAPVDLVVLSACSTGLGKDVRGEGLIGLTRGFLYAGASSVVASLWKVEDEATAELMKRFYVNLLQRGMRPAEALRAAQNSIRLEPQWRSPYFWAAFTLQGDYRQIIKPAPVHQGTRLSPIVIVASVSLLLAAIVWWYWRSRAGRLRA